MNKQLPPEEQQLISFEPPIAPERWQRGPERPQFFVDSGAPETASLFAYWQILSRRRWTVLTIITIVFVITVIATFKMRPVYKAVARIEVEPDTPQLQMLNESTYQQVLTDQDFLRTQIQILQTDNLAWRTIEQLRLSQNSAFASPVAAGNSDTRKMQLIRGFKNQLAAELVPGSRVIQVGFESVDPRLAAQVANALVDNYTDYNFRQKYDSTRQAADRMEQQLDELKAKVEKSQQELVEYQRQHAILNMGDKQSVIEQRLEQLSTDLTQAENERIEKEALFKQVKSSPEQMPVAVQDPLLQKLQEKASDLRGQYVEALNQYGPNYPKVLRLQKEVSDNESAVRVQREQIIERTQNDYVAARHREDLLNQAVAQQKEELGKFNQLLIEHNILKGEFETNQQLYQRLLQRLKDATVAAGLRSSNIHIVDPALSPTTPVRPKKGLNLIIGLLLGCVFGVIGAFIQEGLDSSLKSPEEIEVLISTPALALIPATTPARVPRALATNGKSAQNGEGVISRLPLLQTSTSALSEAYRALRTSVLLSLSSRAPQSILVTSASAGEGKTSTAMNLALALAQCGSSVVLIDCDLRKPNIARILEIEDQPGITTYLTGNDSLEAILKQYSRQPNLWVISSGPTPPNPAELVSSEPMEKLIHELRGKFKHIVIDSPPLLAITDATILSTLVDGVVLVVESGVTPKKLVARARKILDSAGARVLGVALNKVQVHHDGYYGAYYRGYYAYQAKHSEQ